MTGPGLFAPVAALLLPVALVEAVVVEGLCAPPASELELPRLATRRPADSLLARSRRRRLVVAAALRTSPPSALTVVHRARLRRAGLAANEIADGVIATGDGWITIPALAGAGYGGRWITIPAPGGSRRGRR